MTIAYFQIVRVLWKSDTIPGHGESRNQSIGCKLFIPFIYSSYIQHSNIVNECDHQPNIEPECEWIKSKLKMHFLVFFLFSLILFYVNLENVNKMINRFTIWCVGKCKHNGPTTSTTKSGQNARCRRRYVCQLLFPRSCSEYIEVINDWTKVNTRFSFHFFSRFYLFSPWHLVCFAPF